MRLDALPLVTHASTDDIVAWRGGTGVTRDEFLTDVARLAALLPPGGHVLNMCGDRYRFSVGLAASIVGGKISLLPSTHTPETIRQVRCFAPDVFCLTDHAHCDLDLPCFPYPTLSPLGERDLAVPQVPVGQTVAIVFTSGSTGTPLPHPKRWGALVDSVQAEAARLGLLSGANHALLGTVPPQHMYGLESTVLMAWLGGNALCDAQPFYPADIVEGLASVSAPRVLVSSPVHLYALQRARLALPSLSLVLSATAPLADAFAREVEKTWRTPLLEVYGCTETGLIATRRPALSAAWHLLPGVELSEQAGRIHASGGHVQEATPLQDRIEVLAKGRFLLHGRVADLVNIAGKRHSLSSLNQLLLTIPGVEDGAFYMPDDDDARQVVRLAACVVAPGLSAADVTQALRERVDPVFLPRPLVFVSSLPRNSTGKLPRASLRALIETGEVRESA